MSINKSALEVWSEIAPEWDTGVGRDGNVYWNVLQKPTLERLFADSRVSVCGKQVHALDISTGNGLTARWLTSYLGGTGEYAGGGDRDDERSEVKIKENDQREEKEKKVVVTATDGSEVMLGRARTWAAEHADVTPEQRALTFAKLDATSPDDFTKFYASPSQPAFDAILMNMAIMDVPTLEPLAAALPRMLAVGGVFVGSLLHPVFITPRTRRLLEVVHDYDDLEGQDDRSEALTSTTIKRSVRLDGYLNVAPWRGFAWPGQSRAQYYFHRPLHELFGVFLKGGQLALDGIEEPNFTPEQAAADATASKRVEASKNYTEFPIFLYFRLRRIK
ncbi:hypothetical protein SBRCBS47491_006954 [Sporothrix bragantina]|uniref:Methyltransferase type 11 n=1 Tax=Sporothrix bragantina TaxID=671064 RepID=A0ABP0CBG9_9PEZI